MPVEQVYATAQAATGKGSVSSQSYRYNLWIVQLHQLRYMICVAEERRFTRAAARLHVAQPSVSSAISALEQELGAALFHRERSEVTLTGAGEVFLPWARQVLADCEAGV